MWRIIWYFWGVCRIRIEGASPQEALNRFLKAKVALRSIYRIDPFTMEVLILQKDLPAAQISAAKAMCELQCVQSWGIRQTFGGVFRRPLLIAVLLASVLAAIFVPKFVFFYEVVGNETIASEEILRNLEALGVGFGTYGPAIKPQQIKNKMLCRIPKLQWITITQNGMCAQIVVRERPEKEKIDDIKTARNVVAARSGIITSISVLSGNCLCRPGQAVRSGELLVSAYTDHGFKTQVSAAMAEIYAKTIRKSEAVIPDSIYEKEFTGEVKRQITLIVKDKRWNIFRNSGISDANCDKMTTYYGLILPGGFELPVGIAITDISEYDTIESTLDAKQAEKQLLNQICKKESEQMVAGKIRDIKYTMDDYGGVYRMRSTLQCEEMIARMVNAQIFESDG